MLSTGARVVVSGLFLLAVPLALPQAKAAEPQNNTTLEYRVKAAFLLNFTRYVEWPAAAFEATGTTLQVCIFGTDPFSGTLNQVMAGKTSAGRTLTVRRLGAISPELRACHLVFLPQAEQEHESEVLAFLKGRPVLTVGETDTFLRHHGGIALLVDKTVQFEVNAAATEALGLRFSSRMLALARKVYSTRMGTTP